MKKSLLLLFALVLTAGANAQENETAGAGSMQETIDSLRQTVNALTAKTAQIEENQKNEKIWKRRRYFTVGFGSTDLDIDKLSYNTNTAFSLTWGKTFYLHKKPLANMVKFGLDVTWIDLNYARYKKGSGVKFNEDFLNPSDDDYNDGYDDFDPDQDILDQFDLGMHQIDASMLCFGPSVTVTPFRLLDINALNCLKASAYFHYMPTYSAVIISENDETKLNHGYCSFFKFGLALSWKLLTIGYEHRWGSAKYNSEMFDGSEFGNGADKLKHTTKNNRFVIGFRF